MKLAWKAWLAMYFLYREIWPRYDSARIATLSVWRHGAQRTLETVEKLKHQPLVGGP